MDEDMSGVTPKRPVKRPPQKDPQDNLSYGPEEVDAALTLIELSRGGMPQPNSSNRSKTTQATWVLVTFGCMEFYNNEVYITFSKEDLRGMRNRGEITERHFLRALGYVGHAQKAAQTALAKLDPNRPGVKDAAFTVPAERVGSPQFRVKKRRPRPQHCRVQSRHAVARQPLHQDAEPDTQRHGRGRSMSLLRHDPLHPSNQPLPSTEKELLQLQPKGDLQGMRTPLKPGLPKWNYLQTVVREGSGMTVEKYSPKRRAPVVEQDFHDPDFCTAVNRWYRQVHRRAGAKRLRDHSGWSLKERITLVHILRTHSNKSWETITHEFNRRLGIDRSRDAIKSYVARNMSVDGLAHYEPDIEDSKSPAKKDEDSDEEAESEGDDPMHSQTEYDTTESEPEEEDDDDDSDYKEDEDCGDF